MTENNQDNDKLIKSYIEVSKKMLVTQESMIDQLEMIQTKVNTIKNWIVFLGVIGIISGVLWFFIILV